MNLLSFETLVMPADFYEGIIKFSAKIVGISVLVMVIMSVIFRHTKANIPMMWYINIPKIFVSFIAVILVFCFNYETKELQMPQFENMLMSTFLVGVLAIIELLSSFAAIIKDVCDKFGWEERGANL